MRSAKEEKGVEAKLKKNGKNELVLRIGGRK